MAKKKATGSKKGFPFERWFAKQLSEWWGGEGADIFWRTAQSGGRATSRKKVGKQTRSHYGDICAIDPAGQPFMDLFTIDLKRGYNKITIQDLIEGKKPSGGKSWQDWIEDAKEDAKRAGTPHWMIVQKRDQRDPVVLTTTSVIARYFKEFGRETYDCILLHKGMAMLSLDCFFHQCDKEFIKQEAQKIKLKGLDNGV